MNRVKKGLTAFGAALSAVALIAGAASAANSCPPPKHFVATLRPGNLHLFSSTGNKVGQDSLSVCGTTSKIKGKGFYINVANAGKNDTVADGNYHADGKTHCLVVKKGIKKGHSYDIDVMGSQHICAGIWPIQKCVWMEETSDLKMDVSVDAWLRAQ